MNILKLAAIFSALTLSQFAHAADATGEANKKIVVAFYEAALNRFDMATAKQYLGAKYIQHNPGAPDGVAGLEGLVKMLKERFPNRKNEIKRVIADGDLVVLHVHAIPAPGERGSAIVDIFRVENGKIVEHWDVIQPVPEKTANDNTMF